MPSSDTFFKVGNPGRPQGARSRLSEAFLAAVADDFAAHGVSTLVEMRQQRPSDYIKVVASLLPRETRLELATPTLTRWVIFPSLISRSVSWPSSSGWCSS